MSARLTDVERRERKVGGDALVDQVVGVAVIFGWDWLHVGALRTKFGWKTPTRGTLARWPDLVLVRARDRRLIFAECKRELEDVRPEQELVLAVLKALTDFGDDGHTRVEVHVWRPSDLRDPMEESVIGRTLR